MYFIGVEAFLAIVEHGSISRASEMLNLSQSTISYRLKTLEQELGFTLVERNQGVQGITLTQQGYGYLNIAERMMRLQMETAHLKEAGNKISLTIGTADSISVYLMPKLYKELLRVHGHVTPFILTQHTIETYESIKSRAIDIGFVKREFSMPNVLVEKMIDEEMVLVRYGGQEQYSQPIEPSDLNGFDEIFMDWGYSYQIWHDYWWKPKGYRIRVDAARLVFEMFENEKHWAIVPRSVFDALKSTGPFVEQELTSKPPNRTCFLVKHKYPDKSKEDILEFIEAVIKRDT